MFKVCGDDGNPRWDAGNLMNEHREVIPTNILFNVHWALLLFTASPSSPLHV